MDNKVFGLTFLAVLASALVFFGIANAGSYAVDNVLFPADEFGDNTYIGTTDVSNMEVASAVSQFSGNADSWRQGATLLISYQDATAEYPLEHAEILMDETIEQAQSGQQNNFIFSLPETKTRSFLESQFPPAAFSEADVLRINEKLESGLAEGQTETRIDITDDSLSIPKVIVSDSSFSHHMKSEGAEKIIEALDGIEIAADSQFSLLDFAEEVNAWDVTDAELTEIASLIYSAALKTNLVIDERSIGNSQPKSIPLGEEAAISRKLGIDLAVTNPNNSSFLLEIAKNNKTLSAAFYAFPLVYDYTVQTGPKTEVEPRLIKQYSAFVSAGKSIKEPGRKGVRTVVTRTIAAEGEELQTEEISTDFYPPVHRVEVYPLEKPESETPADITVPDESGEGTAESEGGSLIVEDPENPGFDLEGNPIIYDENGDIVQQGNTGSEEQPDPDEDGKSANESGDKQKSGGTEKQPVYDKGGNLIKP